MKNLRSRLSLTVCTSLTVLGLPASSYADIVPLTTQQANSGSKISGATPVRSVAKDSGGVTLQMTPGVMRLQVCTDRIVRVRYAPTGELPKAEEFVVTRAWKAVPFKVDDAAQAVTLATNQIRVVVNKATGAVAFFDKAGKALLRETAGGGKSFTPAVVNHENTFSVQQSFESPSGEALYGMGQFQDGLWDWHGIPLELRQTNTHVSVPMLVSSQGYGLLWDNASLTHFNPIDEQISLDGSTVKKDDGGPEATEDLAKQPVTAATPGTKTGTFTTGKAGEYVFLVQNGNRRADLALLLDGRQIGGVTNLWTPYSISAKATLEANKTYNVAVRGGGGNTRLSARALENATTFRSQVGEAIDYTFFYGPELDDVIGGYRLATGAAPMWPKWAYGFWQCRERYSSQQQILDTVAEFRRRQIPVDLLVQDWQYWGPHGWGAYEWDTSKYPEPAKMIQGMHDQNVKFMISVWHNPQGTALQEQNTNGGMVGEWIDVFNPKAREVRWRTLNNAFFSIGTDAWWNDATEPGDPGEGLTGKQTALGSGDRLRNAYPLFAAQGVYEGQRSTTEQKRVVNLTRSAYLGMQRYGAAAWSGDINSDWETFRRQIPAGLNFSLTGIPYWTTDTGGFFRPRNQYAGEDFNQLLTRWFQWSTFCPITRIHGYQSETEMWKYLPETQKNLLAYDQLRYRMLPYNYSVAWRVSDAGYSFLRALPMDFRADLKTLGISDQYMFGPAFLVAPVTQPNATSRPVYLPGGTQWINFWSGEVQNGGKTVPTAAPLQTLPLWVRAGSIVPLGPVLQYASEKAADPIELRIYPGADGTFTLYEDEGDNYNYEKGVRSTIPISWNDKARSLTIGARQGSFPGMVQNRQFRVVLVSPGHGVGGEAEPNADASTAYSGKAVTVRLK